MTRPAFGLPFIVWVALLAPGCGGSGPTAPGGSEAPDTIAHEGRWGIYPAWSPNDSRITRPA